MRQGMRRLQVTGAVLLGLIMLTGCVFDDFLRELPQASVSSIEIVEISLPLNDEEMGEDSDDVETASENEDGSRQSFLMAEACDFSGRSLSAAEQLWYHDIEDILGSFGEGVKLNVEGIHAGLTEKSIDKVFQCVLNDHPELFFVEGYSYVKHSRGDALTAVEFSGTYNMERETAVERRQEIEAAVRKILEGIDENASDYDKVKYVYDTLITTTDYDQQAPDNQNIYSVFINHRSVCQGYAKATQYLLNRLGVECTLVLGKVEDGGGHAWNLVNVDGDYYYVDTTWGDISYQLEESDGNVDLAMPEINYDYLNVTTDEILRTHTIADLVPMPLCTALEANYYVRQKARFSSYDREQLQALFDSDGARTDVTIKCEDAVCYEEMVNNLITGRQIFDFWEQAGNVVAYAQNEKQLSLTFWVTNE